MPTPDRRARSRARLHRAVRGVRRLRLRDIPIVLHVTLVMAVVEASIRWVSLPTMARWSGARVDSTPAREEATPLTRADFGPSDLRRIDAARRVANVWPLSQGPCLRRALTTSRLLRAHNPTIHLGVAGSGDSLTAHAWVEINGRPLENVSAYARFERPTQVSG